MKKIGIFLGYDPEVSVKKDGIGRLLGFLLKGSRATSEKTTVIVAIPGWWKPYFYEMLDDHKIDHDTVEIIATEGKPNLLRIRDWITKLRAKPCLTRIKKEQSETIDQILWHNTESNNQNHSLKLAAFRKMIDKIAGSSPMGLCGIIFLAALIPLIAIIALPSLIIWKVLKLALAKIKPIAMQFLKTLPQTPKELKNFIYTNIFAYNAYQIMREKEMSKLISIINRRKDIEVWYIPASFWNEANQIKTTKVVCVPDIVHFDFPVKYAHPFTMYVYKKMVETISGADHLICYSDYVKNSHLGKKLAIPPEQVTVIRHGCTDLSEFLKNKFADRKISLRDTALEIIREYQQNSQELDYYSKRIAFDNLNFIFYSSQIRHHKNFLNLIKAYEIVLRTKKKNIKLIITANLDAEPEIMDYIQQRKLQYDIISFHNVSSEVLAALNHLAVCAVNPTLFEGGFPFTFNEAFSVGTPSIMSTIPVVLELIENKHLRDVMLFNPRDVEDMAEKIDWAIEHREELIRIQEPLFEQFSARTWAMVAQEYFDAIRSAAKTHQNT